MTKSILAIVAAMMIFLPSVSAQTADHQYDTLSSSPKTTLIAARTNLMVPLTNVGLEYSIGNNWSVGADYYFPWIKRQPDHKNAFQLIGGGYRSPILVW